MSTRSRPPGKRPRVVIVVQNLPVPFDRRVWLECQSLIANGYDVTVVCPQGEGTGPSQVVDGVRILAYPGYAPGGGATRDTSPSSPGRSSRPRGSLPALAGTGRSTRCRPATLRTSSGRSRGGCALATARGSSSTTTTCAPSSTSPASRAAREPPTRGCSSSSGRRSVAADRVTSTNESYAAIATSRGRKPVEHVTVVRTGPDPERLRRRDAGPGAPPRPPAPRRLPRRHGTAGRRRPRPRGGRRRRQRDGARRHRVHLHGVRRLLRRPRPSARRARTDRGGRTSRVVSPTTSWSRSCPPPTSGCVLTRSTRSTTSRR